MYDVVLKVVGKAWESAGDERQFVYAICGALICLFAVLVVDFIRDIFCGFFRG